MQNNNQNAVGGGGRKKKTQTVTKTPPTIDTYWPTMVEEVKSIRQVDAKNQSLPLARIKKIMKLDDNAKMIAAEAPLLFAKACEYFIQELTLRAWVHTEENKRRTLQRSDIAAAISVYDQFDFLIDIVPREEIKHPPSAPTTTTTTTNVEPPAAPSQPAPTAMPTTIKTEPIQYYVQLGQQQQQATTTIPLGGQIAGIQYNMGQQPAQATTTIPIGSQIAGIQYKIGQQQPQGTTTIPIGSQITTSGTGGVNLVSPQNIVLSTTNALANTGGNQQQAIVGSIQNQPQQLQFIQQFLTPNGEITNVPITITPQQMNLLRMQMQGNAANNLQQQQVIIPTLQQQQPHILQINTANQAGTIQTSQNPATSTVLTTPLTTSVVATDKNLGSTYRCN